MQDTDWKLINSSELYLPEDLIHGHIYQIVTLNGKIATCKYDRLCGFKVTSSKYDSPTPVAYREVKLPSDVINHIMSERSKPNKQKQSLVEYWNVVTKP